ncbi:hypothetical protein LCGC14_1644720, partial [marine sediment metagenome]
MTIPPLKDLLMQKYKEVPLESILAVDPGETTGLAFYEGDPTDIRIGQIKTKTIEEGTDQIIDILTRLKPQTVVIEDYRVYAHKTRAHTWSDLHTPRFIGNIQGLCHLMRIGKPKLQTAQQAKHFSTDDKLREWGLYRKGLVHGR